MGETQGRDLATWIREVKSTTRDEFGRRHPYLFFLLFVVRSGDEGALAFRTELAEKGAADSSSGDSSTGALLVLPIQKSASSPYSDRISIGRARNCDLVLRHASISKLHAHVRPQESGPPQLVDLGSHNGTKLDGLRLSAETPATLRAGAHVRFGDVSGNVLDAAGVHEALSRLPSPAAPR